MKNLLLLFSFKPGIRSLLPNASFRVAFLLLSAVLVLCGCGGQAGRLNREAVEAMNAGKVSEAVALLERAQQMAPNRYEISLNLAEGYFRLGQLRSALNTIQVAEALEPKRADVLAKMAKIRLSLGENALALQELERGGAGTSGNLHLRFYYGLALAANNQHAEAIEHLKAFVDKYPHSPPAHTALGGAYLKTGRLSEGKSHLDRALLMQPDLLEGHLYLARYYMDHIGDYIRAKNILYDARIINPNHPELLLMLGHCHMATGMLAEANRVFEETVLNHPNNWEGYLGLAEVARRRNNLAVALDFARQAREKAPKQPVILNLLGDLYQARNQTTLAIQYYQQSLEFNPDQPVIRDFLEKQGQS